MSIVIPCYNEASTVAGLLAAVRDQTVPVQSMEVLLADGGSTDGTREIALEFARQHPEIRLKVLDNPARIIPAALNVAISVASGDIVIRLDAHSIPLNDYVERCLETLERTKAANVGGAWEIRSPKDSWIARSIAAAAANPVGVGDARYRISGAEGPVETVPFGAFQMDWLQRVGSFNEDLLTNEDYEYNVRIRKLGGTVWFNPAIKATYFARATLGGLFRQYARYGYWKARMLLRSPGSLRWRQALPPLFVLSSLVLALLAPVSSLARVILTVQWSAYIVGLGLTGVWEATKQRDLSLLFGTPLAIAIMHLSWGGAFWVGILSRIGK